MRKIDATVRRETGYIALCVLAGSVLLQAVFWLLGRWHYSVLLGNLLGGSAAVGNFLLMGLTVQKAVTQEKKQAAQTMRLSQSLRLLGTGVVVIVGVALPLFSTWATVIPLFFPRIAVMLRPIFDKKAPAEQPGGDT